MHLHGAIKDDSNATFHGGAYKAMTNEGRCGTQQRNSLQPWSSCSTLAHPMRSVTRRGVRVLEKPQSSEGHICSLVISMKCLEQMWKDVMCTSLAYSCRTRLWHTTLALGSGILLSHKALAYYSRTRLWHTTLALGSGILLSH